MAIEHYHGVFELDRSAMTVTVKRLVDDLFSVDWETDWEAITVRVVVPRRDGERILSDVEREEMACKKAQSLALDFAEALLYEKCVAAPSATR